MSPAARALSPYIRRQWKALAGAGAATGVLTAADLAKPWPLAIVVDQLLGRTAPFALDGADWRSLIGVAILVLVIALSEAAALYFSNLWLQTAGERISHELRIAVYDHLQRLSLAFHQKRQKGDLLTRVTGDVNAMGDLFAQQLGRSRRRSCSRSAWRSFFSPRPRAGARLLPAGARGPQLALPPAGAKQSARAARARGPDRFVGGRGPLRDGGGEGVWGGEVEGDRVHDGATSGWGSGSTSRLQARFDGLIGSVRAIGTALVIGFGVIGWPGGARPATSSC